MDYCVGYCTNVHAGADLAATIANLRRHALAVKQRVCPDAPLGVGLWLSAEAARQLLASRGVSELASWLSESGLVPFTLNGFPYGDFHQPVVKYDVYRPTWYDQARVEHTADLIEILDGLLPVGMAGSISTLPLAWGTPAATAQQLALAAANLRQVAAHLARLEQERGRRIRVCLEPEPGCALQRCDDVIRFFAQHLVAAGDEQLTRRYLGVCHDVCHAAVMFEDQAEVLERYRAAGIGIGKVQVSSAVVVPWDQIAIRDRAAALAQLRHFAEDRYLHQTMAGGGLDAVRRFFDDLPQALTVSPAPEQLAGQWRIHFHVPVYLARFGWLETSQPQIRECLEATVRHPELQHFEVETYAWSVLPAELRRPELADGIAAELTWFHAQLAGTRQAGLGSL
jgi:hypothetical protein